ncbi:MAG: NAD(P)H-hydrate dehydratase [Pseudomonadota bacterium]
MKIVNSQQMRFLEEEAVKQFGLNTLSMMEKAGLGIADLVIRLSGKKKSKITIIAGSGNNGGDGLVAARILADKVDRLDVCILAAPEKLSHDSKINFDKLPKKVRFIQMDELEGSLKDADLVVDAIFGTGLTREVLGDFLTAIELCNNSKGMKIAVDIPSGLSSDTGEVLGSTFKADYTCTFGAPKRGLFLKSGYEFSGRLEVVDIGIPSSLIESLDSDMEYIDLNLAASLIPKRRPNAHKGLFGHTLIISGDSDRLGAGYLASLASLRCGAGLVSFAMPKSSYRHFDSRYPEIMPFIIEDEERGFFVKSGIKKLEKELNKFSSIVVGPAIGTENETAEFIEELLNCVKVPLVLDADALNCIALRKLKPLKRDTAPKVLTPHPKEMARLVGASTKDVQSDRVGIAAAFAKKFGVVLVLKGMHTIVATPEGNVYINSTGNPGMATAGTGDVLSGMIASFIAQKLDVIEASILGVYLHGLSGDLAASKKGEAAMIASDLLEEIPDAILSLTGSKISND